MAKYKVYIVEELRKTVWCEADSPEEATEKVMRAYKKSEIVLDADNLDDMHLTEPEFVGSEALDSQEDYMEVK